MEEQKIEVKEIEQKVKNENQLLIEELAEEFFPGNWDLGPIEINLLGKARGVGSLDHLDNIQRLIISFPEVEIVNEDGASHTINDFHIALLFTKEFSKVALSSAFSFRSTTTPVEMYNGYAHSHSSTTGSDPSNYFVWRYMCLGGESELTDLMGRLLIEGVSRKLLFETFLMFSVYVGCESLDGGPYLEMSELNMNDDDYEDPNLYEMPDDVISEFIESLADGTNTLPQIYARSCVNSNTFYEGITRIIREKATKDIDYLQYLGQGDNYNWINCLNTREVNVSTEDLTSLNNNIHHNIDTKGRNIELKIIDNSSRTIEPEDININNYYPSYRAISIVIKDYINKVNKFKNKKIYESLKN